MKTKDRSNLLALLAAASLLTACEKEQTMSDITVDRESLELVLGNHGQITVNPVPAGVSVDTRTFEWSSDNEAVATVTPFGVVRSVEEGTCNVTVKHGSFAKTVPVKVTDPVQVPAKKGHWRFDDASNLLAAATGTALNYGKGAGAAFDCPTTDLSGFTAIAGPAADNKAVRVKKGYFFRAAHGLSVPEGYPVVPEYTLMIDFKIPELNFWYTFFQTAPKNDDGDAEVFINKSGAIGVGSTGYSETKVTPGEWHRLVVSAKYNDWFDYYLDGTRIHRGGAMNDPRFGLDAAALLFFADNDGDDADIDVAEIALWNQPLDEAQVKKLQRTESKIR
jgi:hypothetical protein